MRRLHVIAVPVALLLMISASACSSAPTSVPPTGSAPTESAPTSVVTTAAATTNSAPTGVAATAAANAAEIVVYASDLQKSALSDEFTFLDDPASPGGKMIGLPNAGDKLNAPPEDDPHVTFKVQVQGGIPYHCWIHMKVGAPKGVSKANMIYVQFSSAIDKTDQGIFMLGTGSYLTAHGPEQQGWTWVGCDSSDPASPEPLVHFPTSSKVIVRLQAGQEGVGFDQFLLSSGRFLQQPPSEAVVQR